jgi:sugar/nucleoside kinase (ribokinase family)
MEFATMTAFLTITRVGAAEVIPCLEEVDSMISKAYLTN